MLLIGLKTSHVCEMCMCISALYGKFCHRFWNNFCYCQDALELRKYSNWTWIFPYKDIGTVGRNFDIIGIIMAKKKERNYQNRDETNNFESFLWKNKIVN